MQAKQNTGNLILFVVLSSLVLFAWGILQHQLFPPKPRPVAALHVEAAQVADLLARTSANASTPGVPGVGNLSRLATDMAVGRWAAQERPNLQLAHKPEVKPPAPRKAPQQIAPLPPAKHETITLGGKGYNLQAVVTTQGAGIQSVELRHFKAADELGQPLDEPLYLVPGKGDSGPSFVLDEATDEQQPHPLGNLQWTVVSRQTDPNQDKQQVVLAADVPGKDIRVVKTYTLARGDYHIGLTVQVQLNNQATKPVQFSYALTSAHGLPIEGIWYTSTFRNALIGTVDAGNHLWRDFQDSRSIDKEGKKVEMEKTGKAGYIQYAGVANQYFASMIVVSDQQPNKGFIREAQPFVVSSPDPKRPYLDDISVKVVTAPVELKPGESVTNKYLLYNGPAKVMLLGDAGREGKPVSPELLDRYLSKLHLNTLTDYHFPGAMGKFASKIYWTDLIIFFTNLMHRILEWMHTYIPFASYGVCIILLTLLVRGLMHPVSRKQAQTSIKMQALMPELKKLQEKYKNDRQALAMAQMELYRKHGVSPMGSCWVVLLQMPIFMGLYYALQESVHFRLARFLWMKNLAAPDMLFSWGQNIPWISRVQDMGSFLYLGPYFNLLPILAVTLTILQQKFLMPPATDETQQMQQKIMKYMMVFFGIMFYKFAAGLCIYYVVSSLWGLAERQLLPKAKPATVPAVPAGAQAGSSSRAVAARPRSRGSKAPQTNGTFQRVQEMWTELLKQAKKK
jgi:YidC/Oxa1 family membrane protein insertase